MDRSPLVLAALASAAVPGLDPVTVESPVRQPGDRFDTAFVRDSEHRHWVVRSPRSETAAAALDAAVPLLGLLARRLSVSVPAPKGFVALKEGGRAAVHLMLPGQAIDFAELPDGPGLAHEVGRAVAAVHNLDPALYEEAGLPSYDADAYRSRRLSDLDRAASTGRIPTSLLSRWERALEDVSLWRYAATPIHGSLIGEHVLAVFEGADANTGRVRGLLAWEDAQVADPAEDFAALVHEASPEALASVHEGYAHARVERPDPHLLVRARLLGELSLLRELMTALSLRDVATTEGVASRLRRLDDHLHSLEESSDDYRRMSLTPKDSATSSAARPTRAAPIRVDDPLGADDPLGVDDPLGLDDSEHPGPHPSTEDPDDREGSAAAPSVGVRTDTADDSQGVANDESGPDAVAGSNADHGASQAHAVTAPIPVNDRG